MASVLLKNSIRHLKLNVPQFKSTYLITTKNNYCYDICLNYVIYDFIKIRTFLEKMVLIWKNMNSRDVLKGLAPTKFLEILKRIFE